MLTFDDHKLLSHFATPTRVLENDNANYGHSLARYLYGAEEGNLMIESVRDRWAGIHVLVYQEAGSIGICRVCFVHGLQTPIAEEVSPNVFQIRLLFGWSPTAAGLWSIGSQSKVSPELPSEILRHGRLAAVRG